MNKQEFDRRVTEQERNDRFVKMCGGVKKADRMQQLWNNYRYDGNKAFEQAAKREGFTSRQINAFKEM